MVSPVVSMFAGENRPPLAPGVSRETLHILQLEGLHRSWPAKGP